MISIKDYAEKHNITYEAVRKQIERNEDLLAGHITKVGKTRFLDEEAEEILDQKRATSPLAVNNVERVKDYQQLRDENHNLMQQVIVLQDQLTQQLQERQQFLIENEKTKFLLDSKDSEIQAQTAIAEKSRADLLELERELAKLQGQLDAANEQNIKIQESLDKESAARHASEEEITRLKKRGLFARIFNREE